MEHLMFEGFIVYNWMPAFYWSKCHSRWAITQVRGIIQVWLLCLHHCIVAVPGCSIFQITFFKSILIPPA